jgi:hypothetical protein
MISHEEALNKLLYSACGRLTAEERDRVGYQEIRIELCCYNFEIHAKYKENGEFEILSCEQVD